MNELPTECDGRTPFELAVKANEVFAQLPPANCAIHAEWIRQEDDRSEALNALYTGLAKVNFTSVLE